MLTDEQITNFQTLYRNRFGKEISRADALDGGIKLIRLMRIIYKPITEEEFNKFKNYEKTNEN